MNKCIDCKYSRKAGSENQGMVACSFEHSTWNIDPRYDKDCYFNNENPRDKQIFKRNDIYEGWAYLKVKNKKYRDEKDLDYFGAGIMTNYCLIIEKDNYCNMFEKNKDWTIIDKNWEFEINENNKK